MKGISAVEIDTICFGETSMRSTSDGGTKSTSEVEPYDVVLRTDAHAGALRAAAHEHAVLEEVALGIGVRVGLRDDVLFFLVSGEVTDLVRSRGRS